MAFLLPLPLLVHSPSAYPICSSSSPSPPLRSLEGIVDQLRSDQIVDGVATQNLSVGDSDDEFQAYNTLPGALPFSPSMLFSFSLSYTPCCAFTF